MSFSQLYVWKYGYQAPVTGPLYHQCSYQQGLLQLQDPNSLQAYCHVNFIRQWASLSVAHYEYGQLMCGNGQ